jgi:hypothetical protein
MNKENKKMNRNKKTKNVKQNKAIDAITENPMGMDATKASSHSKPTSKIY